MAKSNITIKSLDLGTRKVSKQNFSKVVTLPKTFTDNYLDDGMMVHVTMTTDGTLMLTPILNNSEPENKV